MIFFVWSFFLLGFLLSFSKKDNSSLMKIIASFFLWCGLSIFIFLEQDTLNEMISYFIYSLSLITVLLLFISFLTLNWGIFKKKQNLDWMIWLLMMAIFLTIQTWEYFMFYMWFEVGVLPIMFIILLGSSSANRLEAGLFLFFFTVTSALFLFFFLFWLSMMGESNMLTFKHNMSYSEKNHFFLLNLFMLITMMVKFPLFFFHLWLPKAHVEAPVMGSMILAGVLLKLGGMGLFMFSKWSILSFNFLGMIFLSFCLYGMLVVGFICFYQNDIKVLVAFSSVNHMSLVIFSMLCGGSFSILGGIMIMIGHGLASSLLFFLVSISYSQSGNRLLITLGQGSSSGTMLFFWLSATLVNLGFPPFLNFLGEVMIIIHLWELPWFLLFFFFNFFLGALYTFKILSQVLQKKKNYFLSNSFEEKSGYLNSLISSLHILPLFFMMNFFFFF